MEAIFKVYYDDTQVDVVATISEHLLKFGLTIIESKSGDGWEEFEIVKIENE